jgi:transcriptional regulator with XRE-family HTH domain
VSRATAMRAMVGKVLRDLRLDAELSGDAVADALGWSQAKVSRIEAARVAHAVADIAALLDLYGAAEDLRAEMLSAVAGETGATAWVVGPPGPPAVIAELAADRIREYQPQLVPGLLQTERYAAAVTRLAGLPADRAQARSRWQEAVWSPAGPRYECVLDARALMLEAGDAEVLAEQVGALLQRADAASVRLRVIPLGAAVGAVSPVPFRVYDFRRTGAAPVVSIETPTAEVFLADTDKYLALFRRLAGSALSVQETVRYLTAVRDAVESEKWPCRLDLS